MTNYQENCGIVPLRWNFNAFTREQYINLRQNQGNGGDGESTLRSWIHRKHIVFNDSTGSFSKTDEYIRKFKLAS